MNLCPLSLAGDPLSMTCLTYLSLHLLFRRKPPHHLRNLPDCLINHSPLITGWLRKNVGGEIFSALPETPHRRVLPANADADARKIFTDVRDNRLQTVVGSGAALLPQAQFSRGKIDVITENKEMLSRINFVEINDLPHGIPRIVHECRRFCEEERSGPDHSFAEFREKFLLWFPVSCSVCLRQLFERPPADVVARFFVLRSRVAEADDEIGIRN
jgi:hypothetical protein